MSICIFQYNKKTLKRLLMRNKQTKLYRSTFQIFNVTHIIFRFKKLYFKKYKCEIYLLILKH